MKNKSRIFPLIKRGVKLGMQNIWRNKILSIASIFVIAVILFIFNIILAINLIATEALTDLNKKIDITVYLKETTSYEETQKIIKTLKNLPETEEVNFTSKEDALNQLKITNPDLSLSFEKYNLGNPLPSSINIITKNPKYNKQILEFLNEDKYKIHLSNISGTTDRNVILDSVSNNLLKLNNFTKQIIFWLIVIFMIGGMLIILNALQITIYHRKKEISIMKLVGSPHLFIRTPFLIEGIVYGISAVILSFLMLFILAQNINIENTALWNYYSLTSFIYLFLIELIITIILCSISSSIAVHEYINQELLEE